MSFDSVLHIQEIGYGEPIDWTAIKDQVLALLVKDGIHEVVLDDLQLALSSGRAPFRLHSAYLCDLLGRVAKLLPDAHFEARGLGEEFRHTWIREFKNGETVFEAGPWDYE